VNICKKYYFHVTSIPGNGSSFSISRLDRCDDFENDKARGGEGDCGDKTVLNSKTVTMDLFITKAKLPAVVAQW